MVTVPYTLTPSEDINYLKVTWANMANGDDGQPIKMPAFADRSVQMKGTLGASGEATIEGSNDGGTVYGTLTDPQGNNLVMTAAKIEAVTELTELLRPRISNGDGTTSLTVILFMRGNLNG